MSWTPISNTPPQYEENGIAASGYYIKFYVAGTTTPTSMATDFTGGTLLDKCQLNSKGYPVNGSSAVFLPHIDIKYKIALFRNEADADSNNLANAAWEVDNLFPVLNTDTTNTSDFVFNYATLNDAVISTNLIEGQSLNISERIINNDGGAVWDVVLSSGVSPNTFSIVQSTGSPLLALVIRAQDKMTPQMFGAVCDWNSATETGTSDTEEIQSLINYVYNRANRNIEINVTKSSEYSGLVVIPDNMTIIGINGAGWHRDRSETSGRGIIVGTYGPAISVSPTLETAYLIDNATNEDLSVTLSSPSEVSNFIVGDIVGIQGDGLITVDPGDTALRKPNMVAEVLSILGAVLTLSRSVDDSYSSGSIRRLNVGTVPTSPGQIAVLTDSTGFLWPLLVATNTKIKDMDFSNNENSDFAVLNLSTYKTQFISCTTDGSHPFTGNPVVETVIDGGHSYYGRNAYEFAYYSHDNLISNHNFIRKYDIGVSGINSGWDNTTEGCKRTKIVNCEIDDGAPAAQMLNTLYLGKGSECINSKIKGDTKGVYGESAKSIRDSEVVWRAEVGTAGFHYGVRGFQDGEIIDNVIISNGATDGNGIRSVNQLINTKISGNTLLSSDGTITSFDTILLDTIAGSNPTVFNNLDNNSVVKNETSRRFATDVPEVAGVAVIATLPIVAGELGQDTDIHIDTMARMELNQTLNVYINTTKVASFTALNGTQYCRVVGVLSAHGPLDTSFSKQLKFESREFAGATVLEIDNLFDQALPQWSTVTSISVQVEAMAGGKTAKVTKSDIKMGYYKSFNQVL